MLSIQSIFLRWGAWQLFLVFIYKLDTLNIPDFRNCKDKEKKRVALTIENKVGKNKK